MPPRFRIGNGLESLRYWYLLVTSTTVLLVCKLLVNLFFKNDSVWIDVVSRVFTSISLLVEGGLLEVPSSKDVSVAVVVG